MSFIERLFNTSRQRAIAFCIAFNLLVGNAFIFLNTPTYSGVNYPLMLATSISCVGCYLFLFRYLKPGLKRVVLALLSVATCMAIVFIGAALTMAFTALLSEYYFKASALPFAMLFAGIMGSIIMFPIALAMGLVNIFWIIEVEKRR